MAACPPATIRVMKRLSGNKRVTLAAFTSLEKEEMYSYIKRMTELLRESNEPGHVYMAHRRFNQGDWDEDAVLQPLMQLRDEFLDHDHRNSDDNES